MTIPPGSRVAWTEVDNDDPIGIVCAPTDDELAYVATWSSTARIEIRNHVIVQWSDEETDRSWCDPDELQVLP